MTHPPQHPDDDWSDQQAEPVDPFAQGGSGQAAASQQGAYQQPPYQPWPQDQQQQQYPGQPQQYPGQQYQQPGQYPQYPQQPYDPYAAQPPTDPHAELPTDQTQAIGVPQQDATEGIPAQQRDDTEGIPVQQRDETQAIPMQSAQQQYYQPAPQPVQPPYAQPVQPPYEPPAPQPVQSPYDQPPGPPYEQPQQQGYLAQTSGGPAQGYPAQTSGAPVSGYPAQTSGAPVSGSPVSGSPSSGPPANQQFVPSSPANPPNSVAPVSGSPTSGQPWGVPQFTPRKRKGPPAWLYVVGVVVVIAALAVGLVVYFGLPGGGGSSTTEPTGEPSPQHKPELVSDGTTGLGFQSMAPPWKKPGEVNEKIPGFDGDLTGQLAAVDDKTGVDGRFVVGAVDTKAVKYKKLSQLGDSTVTFAETVDKGLWKNPSNDKALEGLERANDPKTQFFRVDGHRGAFSTYSMTWKSKTVSDKSADVFIGLLDIGDNKLAGFLAVVPQNLAEKQKPVVTDAVLSLQFK